MTMSLDCSVRARVSRRAIVVAPAVPAQQVAASETAHAQRAARELGRMDMRMVFVSF
jgi:hypothetical protein